MKKSIFLLILIIATLTSCHRLVEASGNGNLDGFWHIESIDTIQSGGTLNVSQEYFFWSVQHHLLICDDKTGNNSKIIMRFHHSGDSLTTYSPHIYSREVAGDIPTDDIAHLKPYGINNLEEKFLILRLSSNKMVLQSKKHIIKFRKL